jgi:hypothetical protein
MLSSAQFHGSGITESVGLRAALEARSRQCRLVPAAESDNSREAQSGTLDLSTVYPGP